MKTPDPVHPLEAQLADQFAKEERAFLHALSTPVSTIGLLTESWAEAPGSPDAETPGQIKKALARIYQLIHERREVLRTRSLDAAGRSSALSD